jgi:hypothetical protein
MPALPGGQAKGFPRYLSWCLALKVALPRTQFALDTVCPRTQSTDAIVARLGFRKEVFRDVARKRCEVIDLREQTDYRRGNLGVQNLFSLAFIHRGVRRRGSVHQALNQRHLK